MRMERAVINNCSELPGAIRLKIEYGLFNEGASRVPGSSTESGWVCCQFFQVNGSLINGKFGVPVDVENVGTEHEKVSCQVLCCSNRIQRSNK